MVTFKTAGGHYNLPDQGVIYKSQLATTVLLKLSAYKTVGCFASQLCLLAAIPNRPSVPSVLLLIHFAKVFRL